MKKIGILFLVVSFFTVSLILSGCMSPKYLGTPSNPSPYNGQTGVSLNPIFSFSCTYPPGDKIDYYVYIGTSPTNMKPTNSITSTSFYLSFTLNANTTYYWQVIAHDETTNTIVSGPIWSFTTEAVSAPNVPSNPSPYNGQTGVPLNPTLSWSGGGPAGDSMEYTIFFGTTPTPNSILVGNITSTSYQVSNLSPNTTYYWQIDAYDYTTGLEKTGPVWSFTTGQN
ncbi:MAG: hypothetical protein ACP5QV_08445 [Athalassotoga sp.]|uniref:hypothetical protein n=2 Tax=Athalassotoga sp. TaxID=2022597 RepID=UPI003CFEAF4A